MVVEELVLQIRATANGVREGVAVAQREFKKLKEDKSALEQDLKIKINAPELVKLREELNELKAQKKELEEAVRFPVETENTQELRAALQAIEDEKAALEPPLRAFFSCKNVYHII